MFMNKTIGEAKYLQKSSGDYIPFSIKMFNTNCHKIDQMIQKYYQ